MSGLICGGDLYIDRLTDAGLSTGFTRIGNAKKFEISEETELKERISKGRDTLGQPLNSVYIKKPAKLALTLDDFDRETLAIALLGSPVVLNQAAGTVTDEVVIAKLGKMVPLAHRNISSTGVVLTNSAATTTYVLGTDYRINYRLGLLEVLSTGAITEAQSLKIDYSYLALTGDRVVGSVKPNTRCAFKLDGKNLATGELVLLEVYDAVVTPTGGVDFLADDFAEVELEGSMVTPPGKPSPYFVDVLAAA